MDSDSLPLDCGVDPIVYNTRLHLFNASMVAAFFCPDIHECLGLLTERLQTYF